ncbi:MAG: hypothetical protein KF833_17255 [Verrucomicrobiae bacterium]|nr:hypothetical protein [Verrucomicrobiae bacterium]
MRIPVIKGTIKRLLPALFRPKLHNGHSVAGVCLIRLEHIRPSRSPTAFGISSENAAHRIVVQWTDDAGVEREGVFVPRRDTGSILNRIAGGRLFPGEHHAARFEVVDVDGHIEFAMRSDDGKAEVKVVGNETETLPAGSIFGSLPEASAFFEGGSLGYSVTKDADRLDGLLLRTLGWRVGALSVASVRSSFFEDRAVFPEGSVEFDHVLIMRDIRHEWHKAEDLFTGSKASTAPAFR